jgi:peptidyl-prolyl cis-trans isomerase SurA
LFSFGTDKTYLLSDWIAYLQSIKDDPVAQAGRSVEALYDAYVENAATKYYGEHLDRFNKDFASQMNEFRDGNLLFEVMQKKIWDVAAEDTAGLRKYYASNASRYWWGPSADVLIFTGSDETHAEQLRQAVQRQDFDWRKWVEGYSGAIQADSGRFEMDQLPVSEGTVLKEGMITSPMKNDIDNNLIFCLILRMYPEKQPRNFNDARGFVINDYQNYLEDQWINVLKKKYPVKINEAVVRSLTSSQVK